MPVEEPAHIRSREAIMLKRNWVLALGVTGLAALCWSDAAVAKLSANMLSANGTSLNMLSANGTSLNGLTHNALTLRAIRLVLPDGTELLFR
jgi:hypothetical protein